VDGLIQSLRYGENRIRLPHSIVRPTGAPASPPRGNWQGKELSYNNINDTDAAYECIAEFDPARTAACVIVKHANPCRPGSPRAPILLVRTARRWRAIQPRPLVGIVALNRTLDAEAARAITEIFTEVIIAPDATDEAIAIVATRRNLRLLLAGGLPIPALTG